MVRLGVNIDHVATLRQQRGTRYPDPVAAAALVERAGADQITVHLREDRRHIQEADVRILSRSVQTDLNLESALTDEMVAFARDLQPNCITFVPEKRKELTTEGGLDVASLAKRLTKTIPELKKAGIRVSLFIDPNLETVELSRELGVDAVELHTGRYAEAKGPEEAGRELEVIRLSAVRAKQLDLWVAAGHGLNYQNVAAVAAIHEIVEFNIGHAIVARAIFVGLGPAVKEMKQLIEGLG